MQVPAAIENIQAALHKVGLHGVGTRSVDKFSLGMKQRLGILSLSEIQNAFPAGLEEYFFEAMNGGKI